MKKTALWKWCWLVLAITIVTVMSVQPCIMAAEKVELRFMSWYFGEEPANTALRTLFEEFEQRYPNIKIVPETVTAAERITKFVTRMEGGKGPDLYMETNANVRSLVSRGHILDLEPFLRGEKDDVRARFNPSIVTSFSGADGSMYFMPYAIGPCALVYNADLWKQAGLDPNAPPTTWEQLLDYAQKLTKEGRYGLAMFGKGDGSSTWRTSYWWMTNGADVLSDTGEVTVNTPQFVEAMKFWSDLFNKYHVVPPSAPQNSFSENNALFASGVAAMVQSGVWQFGVTESMNPSFKGQLRAALMPVRESPVAAGGGDDGIGITTASKHPREAWELLKFLCSEEAGRVLWDIQGKFPANQRALSTPQYQADPLVQMWSGILPYTRAPVLHPRYPEIQAVLGTMSQEVLLQVKSVEAAVANAHKRIQEIISR